MPSTGLSVPPSIPIEGVIFDLHHTLVDQGEPERWLDLASGQLKESGAGVDQVDGRLRRELLDVLDHVWELAREVDPSARRDLDRAAHEQVFRSIVGRVPGLDERLAGALYATLPDALVPYADTLPVLRELRARGRPVAVVSNVGFDVRPVLDRIGISGLISGLALSYEVGSVKPDPELFERALEMINLPAGRALMVGDNSADDGAAAALGIRTLILPRAGRESHGLAAVLRLVD